MPEEECFTATLKFRVILQYPVLFLFQSHFFLIAKEELICAPIEWIVRRRHHGRLAYISLQMLTIVLHHHRSNNLLAFA